MGNIDLVVVGDCFVNLFIGPVKPILIEGNIFAQIGGERIDASQVTLCAGKVGTRRLNVAADIYRDGGGSAANVAVAAAKLGCGTRIICNVGNDEERAFVLERFAKAGVDVSRVKEREGKTGFSVVVSMEDGQVATVLCLGVNEYLFPEDVRHEDLKEAKMLSLSNYYFLTGMHGKPLRDIFKRAKDNGLLTLLDPGPLPFSYTRKQVISILPALEYVDFFLPTKDEAKIISRSETIDNCAKTFLDIGAKNVIIKLGKEGCYVVSQSGINVKIPGLKVGKIIDTVGAGDVFAAHLINQLLEGADIYRAARFGNAAAAIACTKAGRKGYPTAEAVLDIIGNK